MAHDTSETRNRTIITGIIVSVLFLVAVKFVLDSYFVQVTEATAKGKLASPEKLIAQREAEKKALTGGAITIDVAMAEMSRGRDAVHGVGQDITPRPSDDISAMTGWAKMPRTYASAPVAEVNLFKPALPADDAGTTLAVGVDGGANIDAGAPKGPDAAAGALHAPTMIAPTAVVPAPSAAPHH
jgi:hypothetical protein